VSPPPERVSRYDVAAFGKPERTPQGFLRVPAFLTRAGVFSYKRADGTTIREYRPADEVFAPQSLSSLASAPVTDLHPTEMVSPKNVRDLSIGHVSETVRQDGSRVAAHITVQDAKAIELVEAGKRREISCGYRCRIDATPGTFDGEAYDVVQRDIQYNHAALGPRNWGRAGSEIALRIDSDEADDTKADTSVFRLDAAGAISTETVDAPPDRRADGGDMDPVTMRVDGLDIQVPKQWAQVLEKALKQRDDSVTQLTAARDTLQGKFDATAVEVAELKKKLAEANDPKRLDSLVNERGALIDQARRVLPAETKFDGLTTRQIHEAVLKKVDDKIDLTGRSDEYVGARFDHAMGTLAKPRNDALDRSRRDTADHTPPPAPQQRTDAARVVAPWQQPLATTKDAPAR